MNKRVRRDGRGRRRESETVYSIRTYCYTGVCKQKTWTRYTEKADHSCRRPEELCARGLLLGKERKWRFLGKFMNNTRFLLKQNQMLWKIYT